MKNALLIIFVILIAVSVYLYKTIDKDGVIVLPITQQIKNSVENPIKNLKVPAINHIVVIMMENKSYSDIVGNSNAPYINSLIKKYSTAGNYSAVTHPSLPNYLSLIGGSTFGISTDCTDCFINAQNLADQIVKVNKTWKAYMESMPSVCFIGNSGEYAQKHNPFIYFNDVRKNPARCKNIVPYSWLATDLKSLSTTPNFIWISPNLCHDMHNCSVNAGDTWLSQAIPAILASPAFKTQEPLIILTWDEGMGAGNKIPTIFIGNFAKPGFTSNLQFTHYSITRTIEDLWNMPPLTTNTVDSNSMLDMLKP